MYNINFWYGRASLSMSRESSTCFQPLSCYIYHNNAWHWIIVLKKVSSRFCEKFCFLFSRQVSFSNLFHDKVLGNQIHNVAVFLEGGVPHRPPSSICSKCEEKWRQNIQKCPQFPETGVKRNCWPLKWKIDQKSSFLNCCIMHDGFKIAVSWISVC